MKKKSSEAAVSRQRDAHAHDCGAHHGNMHRAELPIIVTRLQRYIGLIPREYLERRHYVAQRGLCTS